MYVLRISISLYSQEKCEILSPTADLRIESTDLDVLLAGTGYVGESASASAQAIIAKQIDPQKEKS